MDVKLCRLCAIKKDSFVGVYDDEGHKLRIESKINKCLQIEVGPGVVKAYYFVLFCTLLVYNAFELDVFGKLC